MISIFFLFMFGATPVSATEPEFLEIGCTPSTIGIIGDIQGTECQTQYPGNSVTAMGKLLKVDAPHTLFTGDLVHGECLQSGVCSGYEKTVRKMYGEFDKNFMTPALRMTNSGPGSAAAAPGNHDTPRGSRCAFRKERQGFNSYFNNIENDLGVSRVKLSGVNDDYPRSWAYMYNGNLIVIVNSVQSKGLTDATSQKKWLRQLLASDTAKQANTRIVVQHFPYYPILNKKKTGSKYFAFLGNEQVGKSNSALDLFLDNDVDAVINGHSHVPMPAELTRRSDQKKIKMLSMSSGHAARFLHGKSKRAKNGFAVLQIDCNGQIHISYREWKNGEEIPYDYFPTSLPVGGAKGISYKRLERSQYGILHKRTYDAAPIIDINQ